MTPKPIRAKRMLANWRPIKTAPKDRLLLLSCMENPEYDRYVCVGRWINIPHTNQIHSLLFNDGRLAPSIKTIDDLKAHALQDAHWADGYIGIMHGSSHTEEWRSWEYRGGILFRPTHWMPLPPPASPTPNPRKK